MPTLIVKSSSPKLVWPELSLQMRDLILKGDMQGMTTLRMWSSISEICRTQIMLQISHLILRVDMHCMATLRMRFSFFQTCVARITSIHEPPNSQRWNAIYAHTESEAFISETCLTRIKSANVWPHSQRWHAMNDNTENVVMKFWDLSDANYATNKPPHSQSWHALYGNPENEVFIFSGFCVQSYFYTRVTSFSEVICNNRQYWKWGFQFVRYISPKLCMHWLILRREMQYMPTLKVRSPIYETCDLILKGYMQKMTTHRKRFWFFQTSVARTTSIHEPPRETTTLRMRFWICEIYITKANGMHALTHSQTVKCNIRPHRK